MISDSLSELFFRASGLPYACVDLDNWKRVFGAEAADYGFMTWGSLSERGCFVYRTPSFYIGAILLLVPSRNA